MMIWIVNIFLLLPSTGHTDSLFWYPDQRVKTSLTCPLDKKDHEQNINALQKKLDAIGEQIQQQQEIADQALRNCDDSVQEQMDSVKRLTKASQHIQFLLAQCDENPNLDHCRDSATNLEAAQTHMKDQLLKLGSTSNETQSYLNAIEQIDSLRDQIEEMMHDFFTMESLQEKVCLQQRSLKENLLGKIKKYSESESVQQQIEVAQDLTHRAKGQMIYGSRLSSNVIKSICKTNRTKPRGVSCNACLSYVKAFLCHENLEDLFSKGKYRFNSREVRKCEDNFNEVAAELAQDRNENPYNYQAKAHNFGDVLSEKMGYVNLMDFKELLPMDTLENTPEGAFVVYGAERRIRRNDRFGHVELFTGSKWISDYENSEPRTGSLKTLSGNNRSVKGIYVKIELSPQELKDIDTYKDAYEGWQNLQSKLYSSPPDPVLEKPQRRTRRTSRSRK